MPALIAAGIGAVGSAIGGAVSSGAAKDAASQQANSLDQAGALQNKLYNQSRQDFSPYMAAGSAAQNKLSNYLGISNPADNFKQSLMDRGFNLAADWTPNQSDVSAWAAANPTSSDPNYGSLLKPFSAADLTTNLAPNYAFMLDQGQQANKNAANAAGGLLGGNALQGLDTFTQNYAQNAYQQAYNNYNTNQNNIYSRLSGVANTGESAAAGAATNAINSGNSQAQTTAAAGAAQAGGTIGSANAISGGISNATSMYQLGQIMNGSGSATNTNSQNAYGVTS